MQIAPCSLVPNIDVPVGSRSMETPPIRDGRWPGQRLEVRIHLKGAASVRTQ